MSERQAQMVHQVIREQARQNPSALAVATPDFERTHGELDLRARAIACELRSRQVGPGDVVGLFLESPWDMIVAIIGVLHAGAAYLPLGPADPVGRVQFMAEDVGARVIIAHSSLPFPMQRDGRGALAIDSVDRPDASLDSLPGNGDRGGGVGPSDLAYVIYTSGSSGKPKGVTVTHSNLAYSTWTRVQYYREPPQRFLLLSPFGFDSSVSGIFWTLSQGGCLVLPKDGLRSGAEVLVDLIVQRGVTHLLGLPGIYSLLLETARPGQLDSLRVAIVAGETCPLHLPGLHARRLPHAQLFNEYGPTEATVWCTVHQCSSRPEGPRVPIGRPVPGTRVYVLDTDLKPCPPGREGMLAISGPGVARGYLRRPELTRQKFVPNHIDAGERLFLTDDRARWLGDGSLDFLGRNDSQVKLRGHRIELGEVESVLVRHPSVSAAVVELREFRPGVRGLVAYWVPEAAAKLSDPELRRFLAAYLPAAMLPSVLVSLEALPLLPNGKIDRRALSTPALPSERVPDGSEAGMTQMQGRVASIWKVLLRLEHVTLDQNFFDLGGHSLLLLRLQAELSMAFGHRIALTELFRHTTVRAQAALLGDPAS